MIIVNGKKYPLWSQFIEGKDKWIGGKLEDAGDRMDRSMGESSIATEIMDITLVPNGKDSAFFSVQGRDFNCGFDVEFGGIVGGDDGWVSFCGYGGHLWRIKKPVDSPEVSR